MVDWKLNGKIEYIVSKRLSKYASPKCKCPTELNPVLKVKRSVKSKKADKSSEYKRYLANMAKARKEGRRLPPKFQGNQQDPDTMIPNMNALRWRITCGKPWDPDGDRDEQIESRCDKNAFLGWADEKIDFPSPAEREAEDTGVLKVVFDNYKLPVEDREVHKYRGTAYVPEDINDMALDLLEQAGDYDEDTAARAKAVRKQQAAFKTKDPAQTRLDD